MPELPEVETIRRDLTRVILNKEITDINIGKKKLVKNNIDHFIKNIVGKKIIKIDRIGKLLIFHLSNNKYLLIHLKMTGQLIYQQCHRIIAGGHNYPPINSDLPNKFSHLIFTFTDHSQLFFNDQRQFGYLNITTKNELSKITEKYGIEPLQPNFSLRSFEKILTGKSTSIKNILLNQNIIAGIGNIYADEICHSAKIRPQKKAHLLTKSDIKKLFLSTQQIIKQAIKYRGTTFSNYVDSSGNKGNYSSQLKVYGRFQKKCPSCKKGTISKIKISNRGTHYCPKCQK